MVQTRAAWLRWVAFGVFVTSSTLNYLDRQLISTLAPLLMAELHFNQTGFGFLISAFSIAYAASSLAAGWFLDRAGVDRGISTAVSWWSLAAISTGLVKNLPGLVACRAALGIGESAGVPAVGKVNAMYLKPAERALGTAANQIGLSVGAAAASLGVLAAVAYGWRAPFLFTGLLGLIWIPVWLAVSRAIPPAESAEETSKRQSEWSILGDRALILTVVANVLWMGGYSLWSSWTTLYLTHVHHLTLRESASYVWIPPLVSNAGGFFGGWLSWRWIKREVPPVAARRRAVWVSAAGALLTLALPFAPDARWATALISISFFFLLSGSVNIYAIPLDLYGAARSGLAISALTCAFGLLQTVISPVIGFLADRNLYTEVLWLVTAPLFLSALVLMGVKRTGRSSL
ncbi:MAG TPA: MFS transporter [Bryobacteraceae bacterium]|nr:MFS transporter [Bryobacteraceae bacterium]